MLESSFNKVTWLQLCSFIKKRLQHRFFPLKFAKFLRTLILKNISERLLLCFYIFFEAYTMLLSSKQSSADNFWFALLLKVQSIFTYVFYRQNPKLILERFKNYPHTYTAWKRVRIRSYFSPHIPHLSEFSPNAGKCGLE